MIYSAWYILKRKSNFFKEIGVFCKQLLVNWTFLWINFLKVKLRRKLKPPPIIPPSSSYSPFLQRNWSLLKTTLPFSELNISVKKLFKSKNTKKIEAASLAVCLSTKNFFFVIFSFWNQESGQYNFHRSSNRPETTKIYSIASNIRQTLFWQLDTRTSYKVTKQSDDNFRHYLHAWRIGIHV